MDESQLAGALAFCRLVLNQPELQIDDICKANVVNRIIADFDKRPTIKQCEPNPNVSYDVIFRIIFRNRTDFGHYICLYQFRGSYKVKVDDSDRLGPVLVKVDDPGPSKWAKSEPSWVKVDGLDFNNFFQNEPLISVRNYELVIENISNYYRQVLNQIVICSLPNGLTIVRAGRSNSGLHELDTLLNLLINAAVNSDNKECYITYIKSFDHQYQAEIFRRITATSEDFLAEISVPEVSYSNSKTIESHLEQLLKYLSEVSSERDQSKRALNEALQERDQIAQNTGIDY